MTGTDELNMNIQKSLVGLLTPIIRAIPNSPDSIDPEQLERNCQSFTLQLFQLINQVSQPEQPKTNNPNKRRRTCSFDAKLHPDYPRALSEPNTAQLIPSDPTLTQRSHSLNPAAKPMTSDTQPNSIGLGSCPSPLAHKALQTSKDPQIIPHQPSNIEPSPPVDYFQEDEQDPISDELRSFIQSEIEAGFDDLIFQFDDCLSDAKRELILLNRTFWKSQQRAPTTDPPFQDPSQSSPPTSPPSKIEAGSIADKLKFQFENHIINCYQHYLKQFVYAIGFTSLATEPLEFGQDHQPAQRVPSDAHLDKKTSALDPNPEQSVTDTIQNPSKEPLEKNSLEIEQAFEEKLRSNSNEIGRMVEDKVQLNRQQIEQKLQDQLSSFRTRIGLDVEEKFTSIRQNIEHQLEEKFQPISEQTERLVEENLMSTSQKIERHIEEKLGSISQEAERTVDKKLTSTSQKIERYIEEKLSPISQDTEKIVAEKLQSYQQGLEKQAVEYRKAIRSELVQWKEETSKDLDGLIDQIESLFLGEKDKLTMLQKQTEGFKERIGRLESLIEKETDPVLRRTSVLTSLGLLESSHGTQKSNLGIFLNKLNNHLKVNLSQIDIQDPTWNPRLALHQTNGHYGQQNRPEPGVDPNQARREIKNPSTPRIAEASSAAENLFFEKLLIKLLLRINETVRLQEGLPNGFDPEGQAHLNQGHPFEDQNYHHPLSPPDQAHQNHDHQSENHHDTHDFPQDQVSHLTRHPSNSLDPIHQDINHVLSEFFELNFKKFVWPKFKNLVFHLEQYLTSQQL